MSDCCLERIQKRLRELREAGEREVGVALEPEYKTHKSEKKTRYAKR